MDKIFVVGCPRSGTTLLQSLLASHTSIVSFPETHLFSKTISINKILQFFTVYGNTKLDTVNSVVQQMGGLPTRNRLPYPVLSTRSWAHLLLNNLDRIGEANSQNGERYLLEKTPRHLHFIDLIHGIDPSAKFIHIIRRGEDVVASMVEATSDSPDMWDGRRTVDESVFWWNRSIKISKDYIGKTNNIHIRYKDLVGQTGNTLQYLCKKLNLPFQSEMIDQHHRTAQDMITEDESWKTKNTSSDIEHSDKFSRFPKEVQAEISSKLIAFDYSQINLKKLS